jgi:prepilin-type N-terminal cleavage/methylation domain-containing protein
MRTREPRGFTLLELVTVMAITAVLIGLVVSALVAQGRDRAGREMVIEAQGEARFGLGLLEQDIRVGSLGASTGVVTASGVTLPMVQVYENVGGGFLKAKPGTDALLVVEALGAPRIAAVGDHFGGNLLKVTSVASLAVGQRILFGEYGNAGWSHISAIDAGTGLVTLDSTIVRLGGLGAEEKLPSGSMVRAARARLYYVDERDELVRLELSGPVPPASSADLAGAPEVLATAFENLQLEVQFDAGQVPAPATCATTGAEATAALAASSGRVSVACVPYLRTIAVSAVVHGSRPLKDQHGDGPVSIGGQQLAPAGSAVGDEYVRRAYQLELAVRNTSLGVL